MKKTLITLFFFLFQFNFVMANTNIVFVDMNRVMSTTKAGLSLIKQLNNISKKNSIKFENEAKKIKEKETKLISQKNILTEEDFQLSINKIKSEIKNYNDNRNKINKNLEKIKIYNTNKFIKLINPILIDYSNENLISIILQKKDLIIGKNELDITDEIIKIIDRDISEFKIK